MGVAIYYIILAAVIVLGRLMPQNGKKKKNYIILMAALHAFVSGFRYKYLTGDLQKYAFTFYKLNEKSWFDDTVFSSGRNFLFSWFLKAVNHLSNKDFQVVLLIVAVVIEIAVAIVIYRHSPSPWLSYLIWNCFGFYIFGFSALKQSFAMAFVLLAFSAIMEKKPLKFVIWSVIAGAIHFPAFIFLPSYLICRRKPTYRSIAFYAIIVGIIFAFRDNIVGFVSEFYYEDTSFVSSGRIGGRFLMIYMILLAGILMKGLRGQKFSTVFNVIAIGAVIQIFSTFDNIFTRLADYYLQMLIIFIPMIFTEFEDENYSDSAASFRLYLNKKQITALTICLVFLSTAFYYFTILNVEIDFIDDYINYRFDWEVKEDLWDTIKKQQSSSQDTTVQ